MLMDIVKKQGLIFIRNPHQLLLLILLPIVLIVILSISLGSIIGGGSSMEIDAKVAFLELSDEKEQIDRFLEEVKQSDIPVEEKNRLLHMAKEMNVVEQLRDTVLGEMDEIIELHLISSGDKKAAIEKDEYTSLIEVPDNFTYDLLHYLFLDKNSPPQLRVYHHTDGNINVGVVHEIIASFQEQFTFLQYAISQGMNPNDLLIDGEEMFGNISALNQGEPIGSKQYYTIGMAVMNVLFIASAISSFAFMEKENQVFNRILLSGMTGRQYFSGIFLSGVLFGLIQLMILFGFAWLVFGVTWPNLIHFFSVTICLALAVGGLSVLLTSLTYYINSEAVINFFGSIIVSIFALLGGSFFPIGQFSQVFRKFGEFTPNGAAMAAYLQILEGDGLVHIFHHIIFLLLFSFVLLLISIFFFPKRGQIQ